MGLRNLCGIAIALTLAAPAAAGGGSDRLAAPVFASALRPVMLPPKAIGAYSKGCQTGAVGLGDGATWQAMRPSRNRRWGQPQTIAFVEELAAQAPDLGLAGLLVGDISQPVGGPMPYGHSSHQIGLDVDIWFTAMPEAGLTEIEREDLPFVTMLDETGMAVSERFTDPWGDLLRTAAQDERVARIFVHPAIKRALCDRGEAPWLRKLRPWYGHDAHFHVRLRCPEASRDCRAQPAPPQGSGCGAALDYWFTEEPYRPRPDAKPKPPLTVERMPALCAKLARGLIAVPVPRPRPQAAGAGQETPVPPSPQ